MDFLIKSDISAASLRFYDFNGEDLSAEITSPFYSAHLTFTTYMDSYGILNFFQKMAQYWDGWNGNFSWESLEGQCVLSAKTDMLGHISLQVQLMDDFGKEESWTLSATLTIYAGQLENLAREASVFFKKDNGQ
ncbi:DUF6228 family protein [Leptospira haakeii]|uniref:Thioesterase n=1 Tax=Leptospira haakeii TaxID=2023198 RepID=A0ABX4PK20_9LEPT|nr:DUF6228 family protein [Leptospira haakeii]PKA16142.1 hypothetical protein CH363_08315 [Leptospira haakeii]PKA18090.1 hypothetical protein CH377_19505 [Leptospira haakeii]